MITIALSNQKGGVGKSTTAFHLGGALAKLGRRVLLVDNDPQASLTQGALGPARSAALPREGSLAAVYARDPVAAADLVVPLPFAGLHLIPNTEHAASYNAPDPHLAPWEDWVLLRETLAEVAADFDLALIDCPPNLYGATWAALAASDSLVIPVQPEDYGIQGLASVERSVNLVRAAVNPSLATLGILVSMFGARKTLHQAYDALLRGRYGDAVFSTRIPHAVDLPEATAAHKPVGWHKPRCAAAKAVDALAAEVLARLEALHGATEERGAA